MILLELLFILLICVLVIDISGFVDSLKYGISKILTRGKIPTADYRIKPIDCSLCMTFWLGLIYVLITGQFSLFILTYILLLAIMTTVSKEIIVLIRDMFIYIITKIENLLQ